METAVEVNNVSKTFKVLKTVKTETSVRSSRLLKFLLGETFEPGSLRREVVEIKALDKVCFNVKNKEVFGLYGKNGAGKTTLLSILGTMYPPDEGQIRIFCYDYFKDIKEIRKHIIPIFGQHFLSYTLSARQCIEETLYKYNIDPSRVKKEIEMVAEAFELSDRLDDRVERFSSGMYTKVSLLPFFTMFLYYDRPLILCDEPFVGLDAPTMRKIREFILKYAKEEFALILSTHQAKDLEALCDRVAIIHQGKILVIDSVEKLKEKVLNEKIIHIEFREKLSVLEEEFLSIDGVKACRLLRKKDEEAEMVEAYMVVDDDRKTLPHIVDVVLSKGKILYLKVKEPSLEDVLIKLTEGI